MNHQDPKEQLPEQKTGISTDTESSVQLDTVSEALSFYQTARSRLLEPNGWQQRAGILSASFQLMDPQGREVDRQAGEGDYIRIDIPGPGPKSGGGYDWVRVERILETEDPEGNSLTMQVRPAANPASDGKDVAHFFADTSTSSFLLTRKQTTITAGVHGRNEQPNVGAETLADKARNAAVASGAISGFSKIQWKSLVNGLLHRDQA